MGTDIKPRFDATFGQDPPEGGGVAQGADMLRADPDLQHEILWSELEAVPALERDAGPIRLLLVEDDEDQRDMIAGILRSKGIQVTSVENGNDAVRCALDARAAGSDFDLILMDLHLPDLDGYGAASSLRSQGYEKAIIALTAMPIPDDRRTYKQAGCDYYLVKSQVHNKLFPLIARCV